MRYYKLSIDMEGMHDIICHYQRDFEIPQNTFNTGRLYKGLDRTIKFTYDETEGYVATDYLANDKGWFLVSEKLKRILVSLDTDIQFLPVQITEENTNEGLVGYYIANITRAVDALCLDKSTYFETDIPDMGTIYTVSKYAIYQEKTKGSDVFKLSNRQEIPIFVSEKFKNVIENEKITGITLREIIAI